MHLKTLEILKNTLFVLTVKVCYDNMHELLDRFGNTFSPLRRSNRYEDTAGRMSKMNMLIYEDEHSSLPTSPPHHYSAALSGGCELHFQLKLLHRWATWSSSSKVVFPSLVFTLQLQAMRAALFSPQTGD